MADLHTKSAGLSSTASEALLDETLKCLKWKRAKPDPFDIEVLDSYPGHPNSLRFVSSEDEHKPLLRVNNPKPSLSSIEVQARGLPREVRKKKHVRFSERDSSDKRQGRPMRGRSLVPTKDYDSLDFDVCYNVPYKEKIRGYSRKTYISMEVVRWMLAGVVGILTGTVAFLISISDKHLFQLKLGSLGRIYDKGAGLGLDFLILLSFNVLFALIGAFMIALEPAAGGSGIKEIRSYLNGIKIPHVTRIRTLFAKTFGVLFSVAGGSSSLPS